MGTRGDNPRASHRNGRVLRGSAGRAAKIGFGTEDFRLSCRVFYHDHCFDGACSASLFTRFHRERIGTAQEFSYHGLMHQAAGSLFDESAFIEGENAIVDFKYSASPKVTWWFDHHQSAFLTADDRRDFLAWQAQANSPKVLAVRKPSDGGKFYDPAYISCTSLIADVARERFGFDTAPLAELIHWANIVDGAKFESAESAVEMDAPAMKLTLAIESSGEGFVPRVIPLLTEMGLQAGARPALHPGRAWAADGEASRRDRAAARADEAGTRRRHLRHYRQADRGLQQVHPLLPAPGGDLHRGAEPVELPNEGCGGNEPVDQAAGRANWQTLRRSASGMAAAGTRGWARSAFRRRRWRRRARRRVRLRRCCGAGIGRDSLCSA